MQCTFKIKINVETLYTKFEYLNHFLNYPVHPPHLWRRKRFQNPFTFDFLVGGNEGASHTSFLLASFKFVINANTLC